MKKKLFTLFLARAASVGTMFATDKQMTPGIAHLSWDKTNQQWGITAYDNGENPQFVFTFSVDGTKGTLPVSMVLTDNTDNLCAFDDINDDSFGGTIKDAAITITYDGNGYQYDNVCNLYYVLAKISGEVSDANNKLIIKSSADFIRFYVTGIELPTTPAEEIYATLVEGVFTLYYDDQKTTRPGVVENWKEQGGAMNVEGADIISITTVVLDESMKSARPKYTASWFYMFMNLTEIQHLDYLNTSEVTTMGAMFNGCFELESVDLSRFDTKNVENMAYMFNTCQSLTSLDVSNFNTQNVTDMQNMFFQCSSLTELDVRNFDISKVEGMNNMFARCFELKTIYCDDDWSTRTLMGSLSMFSGCTKLIGGSGTLYDEKNTNKTYARPDGLNGNKGYFTSTNITPAIVPVSDDVQTTIDFAQISPDGSENVFFAATASDTYNAESGQLEITTSLTDEQVEEALNNTVPGSANWVTMLPGSLVLDVPEGEGDILVECITLPGYTIRVKMEGKAAISITQASLGWAKVHYNTTAPTHVVIYLHADNPASAPARITTAMNDDATNVGAYIKAIKIAPADVPSSPTAFEQVQTGHNGDKVLLNGQLFILHNGNIYNALGQELK